MYVNQTLKGYLVKFLATIAFKAKEFKDIRKMPPVVEGLTGDMK